MDSEETGPVEGEIVQRFTDAQLPIVALLLDSVDLSEAGRAIEAVGRVSEALRRSPVESMAALIGFMRGGVHALAYVRDEEFADTMRYLRIASAS